MNSLQQTFGFLSLLLAGCSTAPTFTIPDPLPEALAWERPEAGQGGNFLGLKTRENDSGSLDDLFFEPGVRVAQVIEDSPAEAAGIQVGDVILALGGTEVTDPGALEALVQRATADQEVRAKVQRDDTVFDVPVRLRSSESGPLTDVKVISHRDPARSVAGWIDSSAGARLVASLPEAPFPAAGIPIGSVVTRVDGAEVLSARGLIRSLQSREAGAEVEVEFTKPSGTTGEATVRLLDQETVVTGFQIPILVHYTDDLERDNTEFALIDLYFISLFRYTRRGTEERYRVLRWFEFSSGEGELSE